VRSEPHGCAGNVMRMRYVAFLRAINTGNRRIKMVDLRSVYTDLGYDEVATYLASGNVIFCADGSPDAQQLEDAFEERFGFDSEVFLRSASQVSTLLQSVPWTNPDGVVEISFLGALPDPEAARALEATAAEPEAIEVIGKEILFLREGKGVETTHKESTSVRMLGMQMTRRGLATVQGIHDRFLSGTPETTDR